MKPERPFEARFGHLPVSLFSAIARIDEIKGHWTGGLKLSPQVLGRLRRSVLVTSSGASTRIEGSKLTDEAIEKLMQGISVGSWASRDEQEASGYYELLENVFQNFASLPLTENGVKHLHQVLLHNVEKDARHRGKYKTQDNSVKMYDASGKEIGTVFETVSAFATPGHMERLLAWTNEELEAGTLHPLLVIANFVVEFLHIHPFQDGNGRLSRILSVLLLLRSGYAYLPYVSHEKLIEENKQDYYLALRRSQKSFGSDEESIIPWLEFLFSMLVKQAELALALLDGESLEHELSQKQLLVWHALSQETELSPAAITEKSGVGRPTVNQALSKLLKLKRIEKLGAGRATRYRKL